MSIRYTLSRSHASRRSILRSCTLLAAATAAPQLVLAQANEEILVTGSRVSRTGFDSPQPLTTIDSQQIENLGLVNVGDVIRTMPQNTPFFTETNVGFGNFNVGAQLANLRGLNPFFGTRTLTLVDTRRVVPTSEGGAVDLSLIPSMLVGRTEVVTGGASAAYGSDAIAGVVNVILDTELEGIKAQVDYGETGEGDGGDTHASFAFGTAFADQGRGHVLFGAEYQKQDRIGACSRTRDWCAESWGVGTNAQFNTPAGTGNSLPNFVVAPNGKFPTSNTGVLTVGGTPYQFNENGTALLPYDPGLFPGAFARFGGDGSLLAYDLSSIRPDVERYSLLGHASYEISDRLNFFAEVAYAHSDSANDPANGALGPFGAGIAIAADNAFLTPAVRALAPAGGVFARVYPPDVISARNTTENKTTRFVTGLSGDLATKWTWDAYYQHGENDNHQRLLDNVVNGAQFGFLGWAIDAVRSNPADPTSPIVCRAAVPGSATFNVNAAGCVPLNIFGNGNASPAALEYVFRDLQEAQIPEQDAAIGVNFRSTLAEGSASPIVLHGMEWRKEQADTTHDIPNQPWYNSYVLSYGLDRGGDIDVLEAYAEIDVPLAENLQTNFAARRASNEATSSTGAAAAITHEFDVKASAIYDPLDWLRFRTTLSRDVRAARFRELFLPRVDTQGVPGGFPGGVTNPWNSSIAEGYTSISGGSTDLTPETADTKTFGAVLSFEKLRFSADWFEIDLSDAITPGGVGGAQAQALVNACFASGGASAVCDRVTGYGTPDITAVDARSINIGQFLTRGYDYEASYDVPLREGANLQFRVIATYLYDMIVDTGLGNPPVDYRGQSGPVASFGGFNTSPDWQARLWVTYARDRFTSTLETRYIGSGSLNALWTESPAGSASNTQALTVTDNSIDDAYYLAWSGSWDFQKSTNDDSGMQLFWAINNLLDKDPAIAPGGNTYPTDPVFFDASAASCVGLRVAF